MQPQVLLVDREDRPQRLMEKLEAHRVGELHRAFSVFVFNSRNQFILQQRADHKYHAGGLWTNTCCSHPLTIDQLKQEASKRLSEEMGMNITSLTEGFSFIYKAEFDNGLIEHEFDHVLFAFTDETPDINEEEVKAWRAVYFEDLVKEVNENPENFTPWFKMIYERVFAIAVLEEDIEPEKKLNFAS